MQTRRKHTIDLSGHMAECEANYARLMQLLPDFDQENLREFNVQMPAGHVARFQIAITERCKYTTMLQLSQLDGTHNGAQAPQFSLRAYHDACMAEVIAYHRQRPNHSHYDYPNKAMFQRDEKTQINRLLGEWLCYCLSHGYSTDMPVCELSP